MIKNLVTRLNEKVVSNKGASVILKYSREVKGEKASGLLYVLDR